MTKSLQEVYGLLDELRDWCAEALDDPQGAGRQLRQQIINRASDLCSSTGEFWPSPPAALDRQGLERHNAEARRIKTEAEDMRYWALHNLPVGG